MSSLFLCNTIAGVHGIVCVYVYISTEGRHTVGDPFIDFSSGILLKWQPINFATLD